MENIIINVRIKTGDKILHRIMDSDIGKYLTSYPTTVRTVKSYIGSMPEYDKTSHDRWTVMRFSVPAEYDAVGRPRCPVHFARHFDGLVVPCLSEGEKLGEVDLMTLEEACDLLRKDLQEWYAERVWNKKPISSFGLQEAKQLFMDVYPECLRYDFDITYGFTIVKKSFKHGQNACLDGCCPFIADQVKCNGIYVKPVDWKEMCQESFENPTPSDKEWMKS